MREMDSTSRASPTDIAKHPTLTSNSSQSSGDELTSDSSQPSGDELSSSLSSDFDSSYYDSSDSDDDVNMQPEAPEQQEEPQQKKKAGSNNETGYRGVYKNKNRFRAQIQIDGRNRNLGNFGTTKEAAIAWDLAAIEAKRPKSSLNFPDMNYEDDEIALSVIDLCLCKLRAMDSTSRGSPTDIATSDSSQSSGDELSSSLSSDFDSSDSDSDSDDDVNMPQSKRDDQGDYSRVKVYFEIVDMQHDFPGSFSPFDTNVMISWYVHFFYCFFP